MKRTLALILCVLTVLGCVSGCTSLVKLEDGTYDKGAIIDLYVGDEVFDFDPALNYSDSDMVMMMSYLFEGLTRLDEKGKWEYAMMDSYKLSTDKLNGDTVLTITLRDSSWSDGRTVQAADFAFAWKRLLDPGFSSNAAAMLYDIKNARAAKMGDTSIDSVGITFPGTYQLEIRFEKGVEVDVDRFFTNAASPALVPLREDIVEKGSWWGKKMTSLVTNGPFAVKELSVGGILRLERSQYYYLDQDEDSNEKLDKYVTPYRLVSHYDVGNLEDQLKAYNEGLLYYLGNIPVDKRAEYRSQATVTDEMNTLSVYFSLNNKILADANVRQALALAVDRSALASAVVYAKAATGLITEGVFNTGRKTDFRSVGGSLLSSSANLEEAKSLLNQQRPRKGTLTLTVRASEEDTVNTNDQLLVATMLAEAWNQLLADYNVTVEVKRLYTSPVEVGGVVQTYVNDDFQDAYESGNYDVILADTAMISTDAFANLACFATEFSGNGVDMNDTSYPVRGHVTGYSSEAYDALIESAFAETDASKRAELLHQAEKLLLEDAPVVPLLFTQNAYLIRSDILSKDASTYSGARDFTELKMKNYMNYKENYDKQLLQVYSSLIANMTAVNDKENKLYWSSHISTDMFSLYMTVGEAVKVIVNNTTSREASILPKMEEVAKKAFGLTDITLDKNATFHEVAKTICDLLK